MKSLNIAGEQKKYKKKEKQDRLLKDKEKQVYDNISVSSYKSHKSALSAHRISVTPLSCRKKTPSMIMTMRMMR